MRREVFKLLSDNKIANSLSVPFWIYKVENVVTSGKRFFKIYLTRTTYETKKLDSICFLHNGKEYNVSNFSYVSAYSDKSVIGCYFEVDLEDTTNDLYIVKEIVDGQIINNDGTSVVYEFKNAPVQNHYIRSKYYGYNTKGIIFPTVKDSYWQCYCGQINRRGDESCACSATYDEVSEIANFDFDEEHIQDFLNEPFSFDFKKSFEDNIDNYRKQFLNRFIDIDVAKFDAKLDLIALREKYDSLKEQYDKKTAKNKKVLKKTIIWTCSIILAIGLGLLSYFVIIPNINYSLANKALANGEYDVAIEKFTKLSDFKDSKEMIIESTFQKANHLVEVDEYDEAIDIYKTIRDNNGVIAALKDAYKKKGEYLINNKDYKQACDTLEYYAANFFDKGGVKNNINISAYNYAKESYEKADYKNAVEYISKCTDDYEDSKELRYTWILEYGPILCEKKQYKEAVELYATIEDQIDDFYEENIAEAYYQYGCELLISYSFIDSLNYLNKVAGYKDANSKIKEAKYKYSDIYGTKGNITAYEFLKELKAIGYENSEYIYDELFGWHVDVYPVASQNSSTRVSSFSRYSSFYFKVKLSGGGPNETANLSYSMHFPDGDNYRGSWDFDWYDGTDAYCWGYYNNPAYGSVGTFTVDIYVNGKYAASSSVRITY